MSEAGLSRASRGSTSVTLCQQALASLHCTLWLTEGYFNREAAASEERFPGMCAVNQKKCFSIEISMD